MADLKVEPHIREQENCPGGPVDGLCVDRLWPRTYLLVFQLGVLPMYYYRLVGARQSVLNHVQANSSQDPHASLHLNYVFVDLLLCYVLFIYLSFLR